MLTSQPNEPESYHSFQTAERNMRPMQRLDIPMSASKSREGRAQRGATNGWLRSSEQRRRRRMSKTSERICDKYNTRPPTPYPVQRYFTVRHIHLSIHRSASHTCLTGNNMWPSTLSYVARWGLQFPQILTNSPTHNPIRNRHKWTSIRDGVGYVKTQLSCILFIMLTCFGHCGPSSGHKNVYRGKLYRVWS